MHDEHADEFLDPTREVDNRQLIALASRAKKPTEELRLADLIEIVKPPPPPPVLAPAPPPREPVYPIYRTRSRMPLVFAVLGSLGAAAAVLAQFL